MGSLQLNVRHFPCDFSDTSQLSTAIETILPLLYREVPDGRILLINNSGYGTYGRFLETEMADHAGMISVNIRAVVELTSRLLPILVERGGAVITIASTAAFQPTPFLATYGATKAFVLHWSLALSGELRGTDVQVLAVGPGPTRTGFADRAGLGSHLLFNRLGETPEAVAARALRAWAAGQSLVVTGWRNALLARLGAILPKTWVARLAGLVLASGDKI